MNHNTSLVAAALGLAIALCGCAGSLNGPASQAVASIPADKALIYLYWPDEDLGTQFTIKANDEHVITLKNEGYVPFFVTADSVDLSAKVQFKLFKTGLLGAAAAPTTHFKLKAEAGGTYYVKCSGMAPKFLSLSTTHGQRLGMSLVTNDIGAFEIQACKLLKGGKDEAVQP